MEAKQVAQQEAERARFVVMKAEQVGWTTLSCLMDRNCQSSHPARKLVIRMLVGVGHASF